MLACCNIKLWKLQWTKSKLLSDQGGALRCSKEIQEVIWITERHANQEAKYFFCSKCCQPASICTQGQSLGCRSYNLIFEACSRKRFAIIRLWSYLYMHIALDHQLQGQSRKYFYLINDFMS